MTMMIDYDKDGVIVRKAIDDMEFCVRDGKMYFTSNEKKYEVDLEDIYQVYPN